ncbi:MAG: asparagine synthase (glutamine-hydrolyzing) [Bacteroidales bacterium]
MCGISGFIFKNKHPWIDGAKKASEALAHRGPDTSGFYEENNLYLSHKRLSIIDLSDKANQPMHSQCGRYVMIYNGEVYNYQEILREIKECRPGFQNKTKSDSEAILEAFAVWGTQLPDKLNGMFAIAIWDKQEKVLFLFRDRIGIKPLYYFHKNGETGFASELKALTIHPEIKKNIDIDYIAVNQFLNLGYIPAPNSIYKTIRKFPAGHYAVIKNGDFKLYPYWQPEEKINSAHRITDPHTALNELKKLIETSVQYRLISDVPYGTFLSGGIDSSLITAVAQSLHSEPMNTFSIGFWDKDYNESGYAAKIAKYLGTDHHELIVTEEDALQWMPLLTDIYDEPYADSSAIPTLLVSQMAREHVTMTLSGDGGDELFMGYGAYKWAERLNNPLLSLFGKPISLLLKYGPEKYRRASSLFNNMPGNQIKSHIFSQEQYLFNRNEIKKILQNPFIRDFELDENFDDELSYLNAAEQQALFDLKNYLPDDLLVKVDRASMHFALETRVPLLDHRIVEWALNLHPSLKIKEAETKWILKKLLYTYVPEKFFDRPKRGFAIPLQKWLRKELKDFTMDYLNPDAVKKTGLLKPAETEKLLRGFYKNNQHHLYNRIWQLVVLQKWFIDSNY